MDSGIFYLGTECEVFCTLRADLLLVFCLLVAMSRHCKFSVLLLGEEKICTGCDSIRFPQCHTKDPKRPAVLCRAHRIHFPDTTELSIKHENLSGKFSVREKLSCSHGENDTVELEKKYSLRW